MRSACHTALSPTVAVEVEHHRVGLAPLALREDHPELGMVLQGGRELGLPTRADAELAKSEPTARHTSRKGLLLEERPHHGARVGQLPLSTRNSIGPDRPRPQQREARLAGASR